MSKYSNAFLKTLNEDTKESKLKKNLKKEAEAPAKDDKKKLILGKALKEAIGDEGEAPVAPVANPEDEITDDAAWKGTLDKDTDPDDFNVEDNPMMKVDTAGIDAAHEWVGKLENMAEFVNGTGPESLNSKINELEIKNSIPFRGVVRREEKRITKLAENLRGLAEVFKSVIITAQKKIKDANAR